MLSPKNHLSDFTKYKPKLTPAPADLCIECNGTGYISEEIGLASFVRPCHCLVRQAKLRHFGENYVDKGFHNYEERDESMTEAKKILQIRPEASYLITGKVGLGKTHLLAGLYESLCGKYFSRIFVKKELDLLEYLSEEKKWIAEFKDQDIRVVMIDDLAKVNLLSWQVEKFFRFYDFISSNKILLQITTNLDVMTLGKTYGAAITDRFFRNSKCDIINIRLTPRETIDEQ